MLMMNSSPQKKKYKWLQIDEKKKKKLNIISHQGMQTRITDVTCRLSQWLKSKTE